MSELEFFDFSINENSKTKDNINRINELYSDLGLSAKIIKIDEDYTSLTLTFNEKKYNQKTKRGAGAKEKVRIDMSPQKVRLLIKDIGCIPAAKKLGISKAQMYARLKKAEKNGYDEWI